MEAFGKVMSTEGQAALYFNRKRNRTRQTSPELTTLPTLDAAGGYIEGQDIEVTDAVWGSDAVTTQGYWTRDGVRFEVASGLTRTLDADDVDHVPGYESTATDARGNIRSITVSGLTVEAA